MRGTRILSITIVMVIIGVVLLIKGIIQYRKQYKFTTFKHLIENIPIIGIAGGAIIAVPITAFILSVLFALVECIIVYIL